MDELKKIIKLIKIIAGVSACLFVIPLILYFAHFSSTGLSSNPQDWGVFGDYIGGVVGTNLSLIAIVFSFISVYTTMKMSVRLQQNEIKFNTENAEREKEIIAKQNKPFLYYDLSRLKEKTEINICNYGLGPLIIKKIWIEYLGNDSFKHFNDLFSEKKVTTNPKIINIIVNTAPNHVIPPNGMKQLLIISPVDEVNKDYLEILYKVRDFVKDCAIKTEYEDIFEKKFIHSQTLTFLRNNNNEERFISELYSNILE